EPSQSTALVPKRTAAPERVRDRATVVAIMGGSTRRGSWTPARHLRVLTVMGGAELDFRDAVFAPGVTEVSIFTFMGGVQALDLLKPIVAPEQLVAHEDRGSGEHAAADRLLGAGA